MAQEAPTLTTAAAPILPLTQKRNLGFWEIWNMSFGFLGIQFGFALQNANVSRIFETMGGTEIALYWLAAPLTGLLVQPIIGYISDRTWHPRLGRRRPFFLLGAILASAALFVMPNSSALWMAVGMLWILDTSINISMEPFRALVGDMLPSHQRTLGFGMQTFFIGIGAVVASLLPYIFTNWLGIPNTAPEGQIPLSVKWSFYIGGVVFFLAVLWTVLRTKEYPPEDLEAFRAENSKTSFWQGVTETVMGIFSMPKTMMQLAVVQFFSWFALFAMWIFTTRAVTSHVYGTSDTTSALYNEGADWVGVCFGVYNGISALAAVLLLPRMVKASNRRITHMISLILGGLGLISIYFIQNPNLILLSMVGVGIAWASILSIPYTILAGSLPPNRMGYFMGVFNFFIVIPQILAGFILDFMTDQVFDGRAIFTLILGGCAMIVGGLLTLRVHDVDEVRA